MTRQQTEFAAAERRAEYRALATDPEYEPLGRWVCPICESSSPRSSTRCDTCGSMGPSWRQPGDEATYPTACRRSGRSSGQALAEMALALPVLLFLGLGFLEAGFLVADKAGQDRATAVLAEWAAEHPGEPWAAVADRELPGCDVEVSHPTDAPDLVVAAATCEYQPRVTSNLWSGLPISSEEAAAGAPPSVAPTAEPSPTP